MLLNAYMEQAILHHATDCAQLANFRRLRTMSFEIYYRRGRTVHVACLALEHATNSSSVLEGSWYNTVTKERRGLCGQRFQHSVHRLAVSPNICRKLRNAFKRDRWKEMHLRQREEDSPEYQAVLAIPSRFSIFPKARCCYPWTAGHGGLGAPRAKKKLRTG